MAGVSEPEPVADANVRIAWAADAEEIAELQVRVWRTSYAGLLPDDVISAVDTEAFASHWHESLRRPPDARNRVLLALEEGTVVGFSAVGPADDPDTDPVADGMITAFHIDPAKTGRGHGSRLLNATIDTLAADGFERAYTWLFAADDAMRGFLTATGWAPDGAHRELALHEDGSVQVKQVRLHCTVPQEGLGPAANL